MACRTISRRQHGLLPIVGLGVELPAHRCSDRARVLAQRRICAASGRPEPGRYPDRRCRTPGYMVSRVSGSVSAVEAVRPSPSRAWDAVWPRLDSVKFAQKARTRRGRRVDVVGDWLAVAIGAEAGMEVDDRDVLAPFRSVGDGMQGAVRPARPAAEKNMPSDGCTGLPTRGKATSPTFCDRRRALLRLYRRSNDWSAGTRQSAISRYPR